MTTRIKTNLAIFHRKRKRAKMWGGAVNRQPSYRTRNLQRRGFEYGMCIKYWIFLKKNIPSIIRFSGSSFFVFLAVEYLIISFLLALSPFSVFSQTKNSKKKSSQKSKPMSPNIFFDMLHMDMRFGLSGSFFDSSHRDGN